MPERTRSSIVVDAQPAAVMRVVADFDAYPEWTGAVKDVEVRTRSSDGRPEQVWFALDAGAVKDSYVLRYEWDDDRAVRWHLVEAAQLLTAMDGSYTLAPVDAGTEVAYELAVDVRVPMLGMVKRKAERVIIDTALHELKKRVES